MGIIMSTREAAKIIGCSQAEVRNRMRQGDWDLGDVIPPDRKKGRQNWKFYIYPEKLKEQFHLNALPGGGQLE